MATKEKIKALAYMRTSSATNAGDDKDSVKRQRAAIAAYAKRAGYKIEEGDWFYDAAVKGTDTLEERPAFNQLLDRIEGNGVRVVLIEDTSRFARDLMTQELGILSLASKQVRVITANGEDLTDTSDPMKIAMRQIAGAFAQLEKARLVAKLKGARERKRATGVKVEGRKGYAEREHGAALIEAAHRLNDGRSLRAISTALADEGYKASSGKPFSAAAVKRILGAEPLKSAALKRTTVRGKRILNGAG